MNRILEVDDRPRFALVEPGVSYFDLYRHIEERGLKVWIDCPDPGWGSLIGNALDHGVGYTLGPYRDHFGAHCGMEVVLRERRAACAPAWARYPERRPGSEYQVRVRARPRRAVRQGNFGIVTKMGFWLMPQPEAYRAGLVLVPRRRDLIALVDQVNYLEHASLIGQPNYACPLQRLVATEPELRALLEKPGGPTDDELDRFAASRSSTRGSASCSSTARRAPSLRTGSTRKELVARKIPGARLIDGESLPVPLTREQIEQTTGPYPTNMRRNVTQGVPSLGIWKNLGRTEDLPEAWAQGHVGLFAVIPRSAEAVFEIQHVFSDTLRDLGLQSGISAVSTPLNWYQFAFLFSAGFSTGGGDAVATPEGKAKVRDGLKAPTRTSSALRPSRTFACRAWRRSSATRRETRREQERELIPIDRRADGGERAVQPDRAACGETTGPRTPRRRCTRPMWAPKASGCASVRPRFFHMPKLARPT